MEPILPHLDRIPSQLHGAQHPVNSYVWRRKEGAILIDPVADLTPSALGGQRVTDILITHVQEENAAGCFQFPEARVYVPAGDEYLCRGRDGYEALITKWPPPWEWETRGNYNGNLAGARNERPLAKPLPLGEPLKPGGSILGCRVLSTPGHGKHAVTILAEIDGQRVAFCGDLIYGDGKLWNWFDSDWDYGLEGGPRSLLESVARLREAEPAVLCPTHGPTIRTPRAALDRLTANLHAILDPPASEPFDAASIAVPEDPSPASGFRRLLPAVHQYNATYGNCAVLLSKSGHALLIDDGLCFWEPLPKRAAYHREMMTQLKQSLGISRIELVIPTHYHGDHIENIPEIVAMDGSEVVCLDTVAEVIEHPERFNLACPLPWYGTSYDTVKIDRRVPSGTRLRWREYELEIFHLGGQTYYHAGIAVNVNGRRVIFAGDSIGSTTPVCEPVLCYNDCEPIQRGWLYAIERLIERRPDLVVCGHAYNVRNPMPLLERKRAAWRRRMEQYAALNPRASFREFFDPFHG